MKQYLDLLRDVLENGTVREDRTGTGTIAVFGRQIRFDLSEGFPLLTTKRISFRLIRDELLWFLAGDTNIQYLLKHNNHIWSDWPYKEYKSYYPTVPELTMEEFEEEVKNNDDFAHLWGGLGRVYGAQWRSWKGQYHEIDQISNVIEQIKTNPNSRRLMVVAYNPAEVDDMALPPCHSMFQFDVDKRKLSCQLYQRSGDLFLGIPFNIASYALLIHMVAKECDLEVGEFIHTIGNAHIYTNHIDQVKLQLTREPRELPKLELNPNVKSIFDYTPEDIKVQFYNPYPAIKGEVSV